MEKQISNIMRKRPQQNWVNMFWFTWHECQKCRLIVNTHKSKWQLVLYVSIDSMFTFLAFTSWQSTYVDLNWLWPLSHHVEDLFSYQRQHHKHRSFVISYCQMLAHLACLTTLACNNVWVRLFWMLRLLPNSLLSNVFFCFYKFLWSLYKPGEKF